MSTAVSTSAAVKKDVPEIVQATQETLATEKNSLATADTETTPSIVVVSKENDEKLMTLEEEGHSALLPVDSPLTHEKILSHEDLQLKSVPAEFKIDELILEDSVSPGEIANSHNETREVTQATINQASVDTPPVIQPRSKRTSSLGKGPGTIQQSSQSTRTSSKSIPEQDAIPNGTVGPTDHLESKITPRKSSLIPTIIMTPAEDEHPGVQILQQVPRRRDSLNPSTSDSEGSLGTSRQHGQTSDDEEEESHIIGAWQHHPDWITFFHQAVFLPDGTGQLDYAVGNGERFMADLRWELYDIDHYGDSIIDSFKTYISAVSGDGSQLKETGLMVLHICEPADPGRQLYYAQPSPGAEKIYVRYAVYEGHFKIHPPEAEPVAMRFRCIFDRSPFPTAFSSSAINKIFQVAKATEENGEQKVVVVGDANKVDVQNGKRESELDQEKKHAITDTTQTTTPQCHNGCPWKDWTEFYSEEIQQGQATDGECSIM